MKSQDDSWCVEFYSEVRILVAQIQWDALDFSLLQCADATSNVLAMRFIVDNGLLLQLLAMGYYLQMSYDSGI